MTRSVKELKLLTRCSLKKQNILRFSDLQFFVSALNHVMKQTPCLAFYAFQLNLANS